MKINDVISGFKVIRARETNELGGTLWEMKHEATGARLAWLDNGETNKLFSIGFKTLPWNDTGVFHILEHSVLNGSKKFPVKEPFVNLLKSSMNTFLNAMTFPDKTVYPVSSRNEQDFLNLTRVYLDAVFCPRIYEIPNIFYQEGWHYELAEGGEPNYNGVVFNEMKGSFSSPDTILYQGITTLLFPDTSYGYVSGGHPAHIPELSYEEFLNAHRDFYSPANSYIYLDGAVPLNKVLTMINEYLLGCESVGKNPTLAMQGVTPYRDETQYYEAEDNGDAMFMVAQRMGTWQDRKTLMALTILSSYLTNSNVAPLKKAILDSRIAQDASMFMEDSIAQPFMALQVRQMDKDRKDELLTLVRDFLKNHTISKPDLRAAFDEIEFFLSDINEPKALIRNIQGLNTWLFDGDLLDGMTFSPLFDALREELDGDYFDKLLKEITFEGDNCASLLLLPSSKKGDEDRLAESLRLKEASSKWSDSDREAIVELNKNLALWQATPDTEEDIKTLPILPIEEISDDVDQISTEFTEILGRPVLFHKTSSGRISHYGLYFSVADMSVENLQILSFMTNLLGELPTASHSLVELQQIQKSTLGNLDYNVVTYQDREDPNLCKPYFTVTFSALTSKETEALALVKEILLETLYKGEDVKDQISFISAQCKESIYQSIISSGNRYASMRASSHLFAASALEEKYGGYDFYCWLKSLNENFNERIEDLEAQLESLSKETFCKSRLTFSLASGNNSDKLDEFIAGLPEGKACPETLEFIPDGKLDREAILIPAQVSFAGASGKRGVKFNGGMDLLTGILNYDYLWSEIRVKGGAYGCGFRPTLSGNAIFTSYRDPNPCNSMDIFKKTASFVENFCKEGIDIDQYIIGAAASQEPLLHEREQAKRAMNDYFMGITHEERKRWRTELLAMNNEKLEANVSWLKSIEFSQCVVGCKEAISDIDSWNCFTL